MLIEARLQRKGARFPIQREILGALDVVGSRRVDRPDTGVVVGAAGAEVADVGGEEHTRDVGGVGLEGGDGDEGGNVAVLEHAPDVNVALVQKVSGSWLGNKFE